MDASHYLAHRGLWKTSDEQNSMTAVRRAASSGYGLEVDVRDHCRRAILSHDPPLGSEPLLRELAGLDGIMRGPVALNIKADGLVAEVLWLTREAPNIDFFAFDASWPETLRYIQAGVPVAIRVSEFEPLRMSLFDDLGIPVMIWLDGLLSEWWTQDFSVRSLPIGSRVFVVSPRLHGRPTMEASMWIESNRDAEVEIYLCTDISIPSHEAAS